jgi:ATP-binding cassette subfamily B protein
MEQKQLLAASFGLLALSSSATLLFPAAIGQILDMTISEHARVSLSTATWGLVGLFSLHASFMALRSMLLTMVGERVALRLRTDVLRSILAQDTAFFDRQPSGELVNRLSADCALLQKTITGSLSQGLRSSFLALGSMGMMAYLSPQLLLFALGIGPPVVGTAVYLNRRMKQQQRRVQDALAEATAQVRSLTLLLALPSALLFPGRPSASPPSCVRPPGGRQPRQPAPGARVWQRAV